jgi:hypothetical protein
MEVTKMEERYYYFIGHDFSDTNKIGAFEEFDSLQKLADAHYDGDAERALNDDEYVFDNGQYVEWLSSESEIKPTPKKIVKFINQDYLTTLLIKKAMLNDVAEIANEGLATSLVLTDYAPSQKEYHTLDRRYGLSNYMDNLARIYELDIEYKNVYTAVDVRLEPK